MHLTLRLAIAASAGALLLSPASTMAEDDADVRIMDEGLDRSQVQQMAHELVDQIGPRLTNSSNMRKAEAWAVEKMRALGLSNVRKEGFEFGRGWDYISSEATMVSPRALDLTATPVAWTPGTNGPIEAEVVVAPIGEKAHFEAYRGKLAGKIVMIDLPGEGSQALNVPFRRLDSSDIASRDEIRLPNFDPARLERRRKSANYVFERDAFLKAEGALAVLRISRRDGNLLHGEGYTFEAGGTPQLPYMEIAAEDYRRLARFAKTGPAPVVRIAANVRFRDDDMQAYNIIGEIPGTDRKAGYVMAGAHFDSWYTGDGAVDNGAGNVAVLEAARILLALGERPRRTIRFVLWGGEEQGLHGSRAYASQHLASRPGEEGLSPRELAREWSSLYPIQPKPGFRDFRGYFNMDNGSGKIRGLHAEGNIAAEPKLRSWFAPYTDLGAGTIVAGSTGGTDHTIFQALGLPAFQFIQDPLDYGARLHHTNIDTFDHIQMDDLRQASTVMAGILLAAANDDEGLPNEPLPQAPQDTDPFGYDFPDD